MIRSTWISAAAIRTAALPIGAAVLLLGASGCGMSEYEDQIEREQKRLQLIDEENKYLGDPIEAPKPKGGNANAPPALFFRPPRGIRSTPGANPRADILSEYSPPYRSPWASRPSNSDELPFLHVYVAVASAAPPAGDWTQFVTQVQQAFPGTTASEDTLVAVNPPNRPRMEFRTRSFTEPAPDPKSLATVYRVYFFKGPQEFVAIAYQLPENQATNANVEKAITYSLQSLAVGPEAPTKLTRWQHSHSPTTQKKPG